MPIATIESLDYEARGIAHHDGKAIFIEGALPGERVEYASFRKKKRYEMAHLVQVLSPSSSRVSPPCPHFGVCGGCAMQHLDPVAQMAAKQRVLEDTLWHIGGVRPAHILPPIQGETWGYRQRARLGVRQLTKGGEMLIGFHERRSSYIADIQQCKVLPPHVSDLLLPLRQLLSALSVSQHIRQIDFAVGEHSTVVLLGVPAALEPRDVDQLKHFADRYQVVFYVQPKGADSIYRLCPENSPSLSYTLPEFAVELGFLPSDFTQVNHAVNRVLVRRALAMLDAQPGERIADLFCGLGNFTLPIARSGAMVLGVEGCAGLVQRGQESSQANGLARRTQFAVANLFECTEQSLAALGTFDKMLIDPPREGAMAVVSAIAQKGPKRIVYVSCNPATLARDAAILVKTKAYRFVSVGAVNMFPHTAHVESIALFEQP